MTNAKVKDAAEAFEEMRVRRLQYRNHTIIVNQPLPQHKQALHDRLVTQTLVAYRNAQSKFSAAYRKLNRTEQLELGARRVGDAN